MKNTLSIPSLLLCMAASATEFHVAPTGNDAHSGTAQEPFATLEKARDAARRSTAPKAIVVHGGEYRLTRPVVLTPEDSGLTINAAPGEKPVFTSAAPITGWKKHDANIWVADVPKGWRFHFLYADGKAMPVARMHKSENFHDWPHVTHIGPVEPGGQLLGVAKGQLDGLPDNGDVEMNLIPVQWWNSLSVVRGFDLAASTLRRHSKSPTVCDFKDRFICNGGRYNLQNALKFLTQPGEWCVDSAAGKVYFWPENGSPNDAKMTAPVAYRLLELKGNAMGKPAVRDVTIRGLTFTCTDRLPEDQWPDEWIKRQAELPDGMLAIEGAENCVIDSCTFTHSGSYAIALHNFAQNNRVTRNEMGWLGCGGVLLQGFGPGTTDVNKNNIIQRNYIHHTGNGGFMHSAAVTLFQSNGNDISLNWLDHLPYAAVQIAGCHQKQFGPGVDAKVWDSYGNSEAHYHIRYDELPQGRDTVLTRQTIKPFLHSGNNKIRRNIVTNYMNKLGDGGALYSWGCGNGNVWEGNLLRRDKTRPGEHLIVALYMDDEVDGATVRDNVCWHIGSPATINKGANAWENNIIQPTKPAGYDARLQDLAAESAKAGGWLNCPADQSLSIGGDAKFIEKTAVTIANILGGTVRYTLDGSVPTAQSAIYSAPIIVEKTTTVQATAFDAKGKAVLSAEQTFTQMEIKKLSVGTLVKAQDVATLEGPRMEGGNIGFCDNGGAFAFGPYEFAEAAKAIEMTVGIDPKYAGGKIHVRLDSRTGAEVAVIQFTSTGGFEIFAPQTAQLSTPLTGKHTLWFVLEGREGICNFAGFRLLSTPSTK